MADFEERTEQATQRRREKAREQGQVPRSRELISMATTGGALLVFYFAGSASITNALELTQSLLGLEYGRDPVSVMKLVFPKMMLMLMPFCAVTFVFALSAGAFQGGLLFKSLSFDIQKLNPLNGLKRIFSLSGFFEFLKSLTKFIVGGLLFYYIIKKAMPEVSLTSAMSLEAIQAVSVKFIWKAVLTAFVVFLVLAVIDYLLERWRFERSIRMTRQEIKEEMKEQEGDPLIKSRIRSIQRELARKRMMQEVPKATVVITNPTHLAVALMYKKEDLSAPKVVAKGAGHVAAKIREIAREHDIPLVEDKPLAQALYKLDLGSLIPEELYRAVAKILAHIYRLRAIA